MTFCLSKGLCAPVGSLVVGPADFIKEARRTRKVLGGGMRQAGIVAAAGLVAIREMTERLKDDHETACLIGQELETVPGVQVRSIHTNFVFFDLLEDAPLTPGEFIDRLWSDYNIKLSPYPGYERTFRAVAHYWITPERAHTFTQAVRNLLST
jgi:threonine aldolase